MQQGIPQRASRSLAPLAGRGLECGALWLSSAPALIPMGFPFRPFERTDPQLLCALTNALYGSPCLVAVESLSRRYEACHLLTVSRNNDFLTALDQVEQLAEFVLGPAGVDLPHRFHLQAAYLS
jgi:hypothetical protein